MDALSRARTAIRKGKQPDIADLQELAKHDDYYLKTQLGDDEYNALRYWLEQNGLR